MKKDCYLMMICLSFYFFTNGGGNVKLFVSLSWERKLNRKKKKKKKKKKKYAFYSLAASNYHGEQSLSF